MKMENLLNSPLKIYLKDVYIVLNMKSISKNINLSKELELQKILQ